ncbi:AAA family ATPase [Pseudoalteromonas atlantica]|uniref:AAA family ATPase n=1 Tax=Pseudoalteromonas atlantica TaxID=288 RepID=UPI003A984422
MGYIQKIKTNIPNSDRFVDIELNGRNLILTGSNGCGKTQLINYLFQDLEKRVVHRKNFNEQELLRNIAGQEQRILGLSKASSDYERHISSLNTWKDQLEKTINPSIIVEELEQFVIRFHAQKALFVKFDAMRQANIRESKAAVSKKDLIKQAKNNSKISTATYFEEYLVSHKTAQAYAESPSIDNDPSAAARIKKWFKKLEADFRELFEDPTLCLRFDSKAQCFFIEQENKSPYRFQQLSSGFSSILSVYADLLTTVELLSITPDEIDGVAFIDEIDAHLHVSLQRKVFSFLDKAFPNVQFIVTTHSPFVVSSVSDAVIYDLSRLEQVEDLSMYSYESVLEGLFNVLPISEVLKEKIIKISDICQTENPNIDTLKSLVAQVSQHESKLDNESAYFLKMGKATINRYLSRRLDV